MLYQLGALTIDTRPFNADSVSRSAGADIAKKPTMGGLKPKEFTGEGDEAFTLSGQLLPTKIGGLTELSIADGYRRAGASLPLVRGDGYSLGWYMVESISERHNDLVSSGVGFTVRYSLKLTKSAPDASAQGLVQSILSIFDIL